MRHPRKDEKKFFEKTRLRMSIVTRITGEIQQRLNSIIPVFDYTIVIGDLSESQL
jgi:hypothetical protein